MLEFHHHILDRMRQRGVTEAQVALVLESGWFGNDARTGSHVKVMVFSFDAMWEGRFYEEQEVAVYFKKAGAEIMLLTVKCRYGKGFPRGQA